MRDITVYPDAEQYEGTLVFEFRGPLCFCSAQGFQEELMSRVTPHTHCVILSFAVVPYIDYSALTTLKDVLTQFKRKNIFCIVSEVNSTVELVIKEKLGIGTAKSDVMHCACTQEAVLLAQGRQHGVLRTKSAEHGFLREYRTDSAQRFGYGLHRHLSSTTEINRLTETPPTP